MNNLKPSTIYLITPYFRFIIEISLDFESSNFNSDGFDVIIGIKNEDISNTDLLISLFKPLTNAAFKKIQSIILAE